MLKAVVGGISEMRFLHTFRFTCKTGCLQVPSTAEWPPSPARDKGKGHFECKVGSLLVT